MRAAYEMASGDSQRSELVMWIGYFQAFLDAQPALELRVPNRTFAERFTLFGSKRTAELIRCGPGHTADDSILYLPEDGIIFMGDLLFIDNHPFLADGDPRNWQRILEQMKTYDATLFVPGHGPVGSIESLDMLSDYIGILDEKALKMVKSGTLAGQIPDVEIPEQFVNWKLSRFFNMNFRFLLDRHTKQLVE
jgi:glyoxylase-like metal-dependent hydrolase (beta-lactamase superfamily II)